MKQPVGTRGLLGSAWKWNNALVGPVCASLVTAANRKGSEVGSLPH